ncbi:MAG: DUF6125 family protein [bacterium]|nr:DUF6125 family protein [bacterium]
MSELTQEQMIEYYHRSYKTVDGLWFVKTEEKFDFVTAMDIDTAVWKVLPKIQARMLKSFLNVESGFDALFECFLQKLTLDRFAYIAEKKPDKTAFNIVIKSCPWYTLRVKSGREHLFREKNFDDRICSTEFKVFAQEFSDRITFTYQTQLCKGAEYCILQFTSQPSP